MGRIFKERTSVDEALELFFESFSSLSHTEEVPLEACTGRVLAEPVISGRDVPHTGAAMDGYAVRSSDTSGASPSNPVFCSFGLRRGRNCYVGSYGSCSA